MNDPIRVLIVDDELPARNRLIELCEKRSDVECVASCSGGQEAIDTCLKAKESNRPFNLILLDVQMPEVDGFSVLEGLYRDSHNPKPVVIFVTAYDQYALRAFDANAVDYLLKPYSDERFEIAIERALHVIHAGTVNTTVDQLVRLLDELKTSHDERVQKEPRYLDRVLLKERGRSHLLPVEKIRWIEAAGVYIKLHTRQGSYLQRELLGKIEARLDPSRFVRIHRSHLVNLDAVVEILQDSHGDYTLVLDEGSQLKLSRTYRDRFQRWLGQPL